MKKLVIFMAVMLLMLSGCTAQTNSSVASQTASPQTESTVSVEPSEEETQEPETGEALEETTSAVETHETQSAEVTATTAESSTVEETANEEEQLSETESSESEDTMRLLIGETEVPVTWEENASVEALRALCPLTIQMSMYGGFEQVGPIGRSISAEDAHLTTKSGDIVLYAKNQIVIFYGSNSWAYTKLGHINLSEEDMTSLLGSGDVTVEITKG